VSRRSAPLFPARAADERLLGGVCAGVSRALGVDVTLVRLAFLVLVLAWGIGALLYAALWLAMPDPDGRSARHWRDRVRMRARDAGGDVAAWGNRLAESWHQAGRDPWPRPLGRRWMAILLVSFGALALLASLGVFGWVTPIRAASLAMVVVGAGALITMRRS
jgi:phage shock protein PspC (stress-responsive transcriptional regulator)